MRNAEFTWHFCTHGDFLLGDAEKLWCQLSSLYFSEASA